MSLYLVAVIVPQATGGSTFRLAKVIQNVDIVDTDMEMFEACFQQHNGVKSDWSQVMLRAVTSTTS